MKELIRERDLSQWHLMIASLLGSLASQQGMFNQAFLNRLLTHSMDTFLIPYFESQPDYERAIEAARTAGNLRDKMKVVIDFIDGVFSLAGDLSVETVGSRDPVIRVMSSSCRFCPIGVGKAQMKPGDTFCPFPVMLEKTANAILAEGSVSLVKKRDGMKTRVIEKREGNCLIAFSGD